MDSKFEILEPSTLLIQKTKTIRTTTKITTFLTGNGINPPPQPKETKEREGEHSVKTEKGFNSKTKFLAPSGSDPCRFHSTSEIGLGNSGFDFAICIISLSASQ